MKIKNICQLISLFIISAWSCVDQEANSILLSDTFEKSNNSWNAIAFNGEYNGDIEREDGNLIITGSTHCFGVFNDKTISGHFIVEAEFVDDDNIGLALIQKNRGEPDINNYTMMCVDRNENGLVVVNIRDCQNGIINLLDHTGKTSFKSAGDEEDKEINIGSDLYEHVLTGKQYSVPFTETNKKVRIFRDDNAGFFHFYYQVSKVYNGKKYVDWMELRPSPDWAKPGSQYYVALMSLHEGKTIIKNISAIKKPVKDRDDTTTGFKVSQREYNWSGFMGDAYVISFDDAFEFHQKDIKFVFWTEMNYIPAWHLNDQLLYTYEFVETWDEDVAGCHEPMSDRLRQWTWVKVLEDNPVRKVIQWHYVLCNPNYEVPAEGKGIQLPEVDEYWIIYPDGSGARHIIYTPKLDTDFRAAHELGEFISIAGSQSHSSNFYASPALTMMNLEGDFKQAHPGPKFDYYSDIDDWKQQILTVHFKEEPDVFCVWSVDPEIPETYSGYKIRYENAWQNPDIKCVHWPVNKRPYTSAFSSPGTWKAEVSHACLLSWGVRDGVQWEDHYKVDKSGRKYREWVSLVGLNKQNDKEELINKSRSWLFQGEVDIISEGIEFVNKNYIENSFVFNSKPDFKNFEFRIIPREQSSVIVNPVIRINNWGSDASAIISLNGKHLNRDEFRITNLDSKDVLIWLKTRLELQTKIMIEKS